MPTLSTLFVASFPVGGASQLYLFSPDANLDALTFAETGNGLDSDGTGGVSPETVAEAAELSLSALWKANTKNARCESHVRCLQRARRHDQASSRRQETWGNTGRKKKKGPLTASKSTVLPSSASTTK